VEIFFAPLQVFLLAPPLALIPAAIFAGWWWRAREVDRGPRRWCLTAAVAWLSYAGWESWVWIWLREVVAPIRVDLLLLGPLLYLTAGLAVHEQFRARPVG